MKITFAEKVGIIPKTIRINQVWDDDINEIRTVINTNDDLRAGNAASILELQNTYVALDTAQIIAGAKTFSSVLLSSGVTGDNFVSHPIIGYSGFKIDYGSPTWNDGDSFHDLLGLGYINGQQTGIASKTNYNTAISPHPYSDFRLIAAANANVWLRGIPATDGASQINSRLQIGFARDAPNNGDPFYLSVAGSSKIDGEIQATDFVTIGGLSLVEEIQLIKSHLTL